MFQKINFSWIIIHTIDKMFNMFATRDPKALGSRKRCTVYEKFRFHIRVSDSTLEIAFKETSSS